MRRPRPVRSFYAERLPRDARRRLHRGRRVPLPRRGGGRSPPPRRPPTRASRSSSSTSPTSAAASSGCASRPSPPTWTRSSRCALPESPSASPPTPSARARASGSRRSAATRRATGCRSTSTPTSSRARSRSAWPSTASGRSSCWPRRGCLTGSHDDRPRDPRERRRARPPRRAGARICACPTTEADLGDGFLPVEAVRERGIPLCIGSDSNMRIDPLEELRELEGIARRRTGRRGVLATEELLEIGAAEGARVAPARGVAANVASISATARWPACRSSTSRRLSSRAAPPTSSCRWADERDRGHEATFEDDVVERSSRRRWSSTSGRSGAGPATRWRRCSSAAVEARDGAVTLAKVDVDANPALSQRFSVSGIPAVKAFRDGRVVAEFAGARPRVMVDAFLDELLAPPRLVGLLEELRASGELPDVVAALDGGRRRGGAAPRRRRRSRGGAARSGTGCARWRSRSSSASTRRIRSSATYRRRLAAALY